MKKFRKDEIKLCGTILLILKVIDLLNGGVKVKNYRQGRSGIDKHFIFITNE